MTPTHFTEAALAWLVAGVTICKYIQAQILPLIASLQQSVTDMKARQDRHGEQITALSGNLTQVALLTPTPPASALSSPVAAPPAAPAPDAAPQNTAPTSFTPPAMAPPAGMTEAEAIAANVSMQPAPPLSDPAPAAPAPSAVGVSQEL